MSDEIIKRPEDGLSVLEKEELTKFRRSGSAPLALSTALKMYELFLLGKSCEEIMRANDSRFPLGMILEARIRYDWDKRREAYIESLFTETTGLVKQRQLESAVFLGDLVAAAHKQFGSKIQKFIQSGDVADLPSDFKVTSITSYKMVVDAFMKITGMDQKQKGDEKAGVNVIANNVTLQEQPKTPMVGQDALSILKGLEQLDRKDKK